MRNDRLGTKYRCKDQMKSSDAHYFQVVNTKVAGTRIVSSICMVIVSNARSDIVVSVSIYGTRGPW